MPVPSQFWHAKRSTKKLRQAILGVLGSDAMTSHEVASILDKRWLRVCAALNDLMVSGQVDLDGGRFRSAGR